MAVGVLTAAGPVVAAVTAAPSAASAATVNQSRLVVITAAPRLASGTHVVSAVSKSASMTAELALRLPDESAISQFIDETASPGSTMYHHYLKRGAFAQRFGPRPAAIAAVEAQLRTDGLTVASLSANHLFVTFHGTAAKMEAAFHTNLERVALAHGAMGQATTSAIELPRSIAPYVQSVVGLDNLVHESNGLVHLSAKHHGVTPSASVPNAANGGPVACSGALSQQVNGALTDQQIANSYGVEPLYSAGDTASSQVVDIYELEPFAMSDIASFDQCYFGASHTSQITVENVDGGPGVGYGSGEAALDVEDVSAIAPGADIHVFSGPNMDNNWGPLDTWNAIAVADDASQISSSWGICESALQQGAPGVQQVENEIFQQTAAQGQTVFAAAGDDGSDSCAAHDTTPVAPDLSVLDPASQPYVTSVGGTTITDATEPPKETVWNNGNFGGAGGGGISETWAMQPWQMSMAVPQTAADEACSNDPSGTGDNYHLAGIPTTLPAGTECRETPDVSALADPQSGITIFYGGGWLQIGGTSSATPLWAAMLAEINASTACQGIAGGVGFADPLLYQVASSSKADYADAFNDITVGNNDNLSVGGAIDYPAGPGYDLASGLGTPRVTNANGAPGLDSLLCAAAGNTLGNNSSVAPDPVVTALSSTAGPATGGGSLTITGTNFGPNQGEVGFGTVTLSGSAITSWTSTSITVNIPAYTPPAGTPAGSAGRADVTVTTGGATPESSAANEAAVYHYTAASPSGAPVVDYVSAPTGPMSGGGTVQIVGSGLTGATSVMFGDVPATIDTASTNSDNELTVTVPPSDGNCAVPEAQNGVCAVAVTVTTPGGTSSGPTILPAYQGPIISSASGAFLTPPGCGCEIIQQPEEYDYANAPVITSVSPQYMSENGTSSATITGSNFNLLTFEYANVGMPGLETSQDFSIEGVTPTSLTIAIPGAPSITTGPASQSLSIQSALQLSNIVSFDYAGVPVVTGLSKHLGNQADPGQITVTGHGLKDVTSVVFQGQSPLSFLSSTTTAISDQHDTSLVVTAPQFFAFATDVLLCTTTGCSTPNPNVDTFVFAYAGRPVLTSSSPKSGPAMGGTTVTIEGALDSEITSVDFGTTPATIVSEPELAPSGPITVVAPMGKAGTTVPITISTLGGLLVNSPTSKVTTAAEFTYHVSTPSAPRNVKATARVRSARVTWTAPATDGGRKITSYRIMATATNEKSVLVKVGPSARSAVVRTLKPGIAWTLNVRAVNSMGSGPPGASNPVTPKK